MSSNKIEESENIFSIPFFLFLNDWNSFQIYSEKTLFDMYALSLLLYKHAFRLFFFNLSTKRKKSYSTVVTTGIHTTVTLGWLLFSITAISFTSLFMFLAVVGGTANRVSFRLLCRRLLLELLPLWLSQ